jgi:ribosomal protein S18 acetylase RimI-like enzyme
MYNYAIQTKEDSGMRNLEEIQMNALPALQTVLYDGWILRFADGYSNRANSVNPIYPSLENTLEKIRRCEDLFREKSLKPTYKITPFACPGNLDKLLEEEGYGIIHPTSVQLMQLDEEYCPQVAENILARTVPALEDAWHDAYAEMNHISPENKRIHRKILDSLVPERIYASLLLEDRIIACGMAVVERGYIGLYDIVVEEQHRNHGYGRRLMAALLNAGRGLGATQAYLQVMLDNPPALRLYKKLGFKESYRYHYRQRAEVVPG